MCVIDILVVEYIIAQFRDEGKNVRRRDPRCVDKLSADKWGVQLRWEEGEICRIMTEIAA